MSDLADDYTEIFVVSLRDSAQILRLHYPLDKNAPDNLAWQFDGSGGIAD